MKNNVCVGEILNTESPGGPRTVLVRRPIGVHLHSMGRPVEGDAVELLPEEALFLAEKNKLVVEFFGTKVGKFMNLITIYNLLLSEKTILEGGLCSLEDVKVLTA